MNENVRRGAGIAALVVVIVVVAVIVSRRQDREQEGLRDAPPKSEAQAQGPVAAEDSLNKHADDMRKLTPEGREQIKQEQEMEKKHLADSLGHVAELRKDSIDAIKLKPLMDKYSCSVEQARCIKKHQVQIGMSKKMCIASWGRPDHVNTTTTRYSTHEQWVYDGGYLYFENDELTSIQN